MVLLDGKAIGIEPCLYVAGADATSVARRVLELEQSSDPSVSSELGA